jgi:hypothetical protein
MFRGSRIRETAVRFRSRIRENSVRFQRRSTHTTQSLITTHELFGQSQRTEPVLPFLRQHGLCSGFPVSMLQVARTRGRFRSRNIAIVTPQ